MNKALIAGALGVTGRTLVNHLASLGNWEENCDGQAFNITNGDFNRWENIWPRLAEFFKMEYAPPQHFPLALFMSGNAASTLCSISEDAIHSIVTGP
jgi:hypothetical protein